LILLSAKSCLLGMGSLTEGQIEVTVVGIEERAGKMMESLSKRRVKLTLDNGNEDVAVSSEFGRVSLRHAKIVRMSEEAIDQQGVLSQEDLSKYLNCTVRTIQRDIKAMKEKGQTVITRGYLHNIGRCQTHKVKIIRLYLEGKTYSEIKLTTRHSVGSIKRYIESFTKVVMCIKSGITRKKEISMISGLSEHLIEQYKTLLKEIKRKKETRENLGLLIERSSYREGIKKSSANYTDPLAAMIRGSL